MARRRKNLSEKRNEEEKVCVVLFSFSQLIIHDFGLKFFQQFPFHVQFSRSPFVPLYPAQLCVRPLKPHLAPTSTNFTAAKTLPSSPPSFPFPPLSSPLHLLPLLIFQTQMDTINRLLKKQAPKRRGKISAAELSAAAAGVPLSASALKGKSHNASNDDALSRDEEMTANPVFTRWVSDRSGCRVGVPGEWLGKGVRVGAVFGAVAEVEG